MMLLRKLLSVLTIFRLTEQNTFVPLALGLKNTHLQDDGFNCTTYSLGKKKFVYLVIFCFVFVTSEQPVEQMQFEGSDFMDGDRWCW